MHVRNTIHEENPLDPTENHAEDYRKPQYLDITCTKGALFLPGRGDVTPEALGKALRKAFLSN